MQEALRAYFIAPKRLSNEFGGTIGAEPATWLGAAAGLSETDGFNAGLAVATFGADVFGEHGAFVPGLISEALIL